MPEPVDIRAVLDQMVPSILMAVPVAAIRSSIIPEIIWMIFLMVFSEASKERASAMVSIPGTIGSFLQIDPEAHPVWYTFFRTFNYTSWLYIVIYLLLILAFNYFYVAIQYNPVEIANNLRRNNGSIPGFRPGKPTSDFITRTLNKITLIGAIFLAVVAVLPIILGNLTGLSIQLGGTSLLIVVGVALDTTRALDSFMTMRNHKGFLG